MRLSEQRFVDLLRFFRSPDPTPGGGSASALSGAVGAALLAMVAGLPKPRAQTAEDAGRLIEAAAHCASLSDRLAVLLDRDSDAYELVVGAFRLPKGTDEERTVRSSRIQEALREATEAPLDVMRMCAEGIHVAAIVAQFGNVNASSDVRVGLELLAAGLRGARLNVQINLASMKDSEYVAATTAAAEELAASAEQAQAAAIRLLDGGS